VEDGLEVLLEGCFLLDGCKGGDGDKGMDDGNNFVADLEAAVSIAGRFG
jgi:hypothetical protein